MLADKDDLTIISNTGAGVDSDISFSIQDTEDEGAYDTFHITMEEVNDDCNLTRRKTVLFSDTVQAYYFGWSEPTVAVVEPWRHWTHRMIAGSKTAQFCCLNLAAVDCLGLFNGSVLVRNRAFEKRAFIRLTVDDWHSFIDVPVNIYPSSSPCPDYDNFEFEFDLNCFMLQGNVQLLFAVGCVLDGVEYWDNNEDRNYEILTTSDLKQPAALNLIPLKDELLEVVYDYDSGDDEEVSGDLHSSCSVGVYSNYFLPTSVILNDWTFH
jgi:hypothetical protein